MNWRLDLFDVVRLGASQKEDTAERTPLRTTLAHDQQCLQTFMIGLVQQSKNEVSASNTI